MCLFLLGGEYEYEYVTQNVRNEADVGASPPCNKGNSEPCTNKYGVKEGVERNFTIYVTLLLRRGRYTVCIAIYGMERATLGSEIMIIKTPVIWAPIISGRASDKPSQRKT
jgi:hypothetical protein